MERIREWIEGFLRGRYGYEDPGAFRALAVPVLIGSVLVVGWLLVGPLITIPRISVGGTVVRNGVAAVVVCGKKSGTGEHGIPKGLGAATKYAPEPRTGTWAHVREGECTTWYHRPPGAEQRSNRHQRAANLSVSGEMLQTEGVRRSRSQFQTLPVVEKLPEPKGRTR